MHRASGERESALMVAGLPRIGALRRRHRDEFREEAVTDLFGEQAFQAAAYLSSSRRRPKRWWRGVRARGRLHRNACRLNHSDPCTQADCITTRTRTSVAPRRGKFRSGGRIVTDETRRAASILDDTEAEKFARMAEPGRGTETSFRPYSRERKRDRAR